MRRGTTKLDVIRCLSGFLRTLSVAWLGVACGFLPSSHVVAQSSSVDPVTHDQTVAECFNGLRPTFLNGHPHPNQSITRSDYLSNVDYETALYKVFLTPILTERAEQEREFREKHDTGYINGRWLPRRIQDDDRMNYQTQLDAYLMHVSPVERPSGLLVYWPTESRRLCAGLVLLAERMIVDAAPAESAEMRVPQANVSDRVDARLATPRNGSRLRTRVRNITFDNDLSDLGAAANKLLPGVIKDRIEQRELRSLIIEPIYGYGRVPFAALPVNDREQLIDYVDITIGFGSYKREAREQTAALANTYAHALIVGDPDLTADPKWKFPKLPGARQEAKDVAALYQSTPLLGPKATHAAVIRAITSQESPDLIYLATHAVSDPVNPQDASFIALTGKNLTTREVEKLKLTNSPLVVLSACQTGVGKEFSGGMFGMAQAWYFSGAGSIVTSLWNVNDGATRELMGGFMSRLQHDPPAHALAEAMRELRARRPNVSEWASFTIYGGIPPYTKLRGD